MSCIEMCCDGMDGWLAYRVAPPVARGWRGTLGGWGREPCPGSRDELLGGLSKLQSPNCWRRPRAVGGANIGLEADVPLIDATEG